MPIQDIFFLSFGGWETQIEVQARLVSGETSLPGLWISAVSLCPHLAFPLWVCGERDQGSSSVSSSKEH